MQGLSHSQEEALSPRKAAANTACPALLLSYALSLWEPFWGGGGCFTSVAWSFIGPSVARGALAPTVGERLLGMGTERINSSFRKKPPNGCWVQALCRGLSACPVLLCATGSLPLAGRGVGTHIRGARPHCRHAASGAKGSRCHPRLPPRQLTACAAAQPAEGAVPHLSRSERFRAHAHRPWRCELGPSPTRASQRGVRHGEKERKASDACLSAASPCTRLSRFQKPVTVQACYRGASLNIGP